MTKTNIAWTERTWNPVSGCSKVSPGCAHCYAEAISLRYGRSALPWTPQNAAENVVLKPHKLDEPLTRRIPTMWFVNSMSDLFHELVPDDYIAQVFGVMAMTPHHTYQVLTKRPDRMLEWVSKYNTQKCEAAASHLLARYRDRLLPPHISFGRDWPLKNVWLGTSVELQRWANVRIPLLLQTPARVRFISAEPLLGPVDLRPFLWEAAGPEWAGQNLAEPGLDWVIVGGESGAKRRRYDLDWARSIRDQCVEASVAFFYKQGAHNLPGQLRELDGRLWEEYPAA